VCVNNGCSIYVCMWKHWHVYRETGMFLEESCVCVCGGSVLTGLCLRREGQGCGCNFEMKTLRERCVCVCVDGETRLGVCVCV